VSSKQRVRFWKCWNAFTDIGREKRQTRDKFDLLTAVHKAEYEHVKRPVSRRTGKAIEPAHKFEVSLESDGFSKEK